MKIKQFMEDLEAGEDCKYLIRSQNTEFFTFQPIPESNVLEPNILYICYSAQIPLIEDDSVYHFLCHALEDESTLADKLKLCYPNSNFLLLRYSGGIEKLFDKTSKIFLAETRYISQVSQLLAIFDQKKGLQFLVDEAYRMAHAPIIIVDTSYRILAIYDDQYAEDEFDLKEQREIGYITEYNIKRMKRDYVYEQLRSSSEKMIFTKAADSKYFWLDMLVRVHGIEVAEIGILEYEHPFSRYDFEFFNFFKQLVTWEMEKNSSFLPTSASMHSTFLSELLEQKFTSRESIERRRKMLRWKESNYHYVLTVSAAGHKNFHNKAEIIAQQVTGILPDCYWAITNSLVFLIIADDEKLEPFLPGSPLSQLFERNHIQGILSNCFSDLKQMKKYFDQTAAVLEFHHLADTDIPIHFYADYSIFHMAKIVSETNELKDFYHPLIQMIKETDRTNHTKYLDTLREYLIHIDNPSLCAQNLCIHKNTFFYRMNKLRELFSIDLSDGLVRMRLLFTLELMRLEQE